jgi:hypothetical protein
MSNNHLYYKLSTVERLSVFLRARARGDTVEADTVVSASPRLNMSVPDFYPYLETLQVMLLLHWLSQMDRLLGFLGLTSVWKDNLEAFALARRLANTYLATEAAWRAVCDEYGLDYDQSLSVILSESPAFACLHRSDILQSMAQREREESSEAICDRVTVEQQKREYKDTIQDLVHKLLNQLV